ncbi:hypothetical protein NFI96_016571, partial [Prochilodus magdalenae]
GSVSFTCQYLVVLHIACVTCSCVPAEMEAVFQAPKRRPKVYESFESPLPVLVTTEASSDQSGIYKAEVINQHVIVREPDHIQALYGKGYFGKGVLSRSRPEHSISERWEYVGDRCLPVIPLAQTPTGPPQSRYRKHVRWAHAALLSQGLEEEAVSRLLQKLMRPVEPNPGEEHCEEHEQAGHPNTQERAAPSSDSLIQDQPAEDVAAAQGVRDEGKDSEAERPRRQGDPLYDPLAELYPKEPEQVDPNALAKVKCKRHDDWIAHCGCRLDETQMASVLFESGTEGGDPSIAQGYVLVEEPSEEDDGDPAHPDASRVMKVAMFQTHLHSILPSVPKVRTAKLVCRINPFSLIEYLQLSYEEAFFLVYALGCLSVYYEGEPLSVLQVWQMFRSAQPNFETTYAAYHYFRSKGWVPKPGVKYGTDLMLYRKGPPFYHASYSVVVEKVDKAFQGAPLRPFSWRSFAALSRTTGNVSKELMLCYVIMPPDVSTPEFLRRVKVQELIVSRWISSRERTEQDDM